MWANAQRDGRPAKYRWRPLFNAAKFGWRPLPKLRTKLCDRAQMAIFLAIFASCIFSEPRAARFRPAS